MARTKGSIGKGSITSKLIGMQVGDRQYVETALKDYATRMSSLNVPPSRRNEAIKDFVLKTTLFTAVSNSRAGDIRYLICVERIG